MEGVSSPRGQLSPLTPRKGRANEKLAKNKDVTDFLQLNLEVHTFI